MSAPMVKPIRLRLSRAKGFDLQALSIATNGLRCVVVARPTKWGNHADWRDWRESFPENILAQEGPEFRDRWCRQQAVDAYAQDWEDGEMEALRPFLSELCGHNLACWCAPGRMMCHADVLLKLANIDSPPIPKREKAA